ncbi:MAG: hypothetical protein HY079_04715, partial [Elusimicrobia bacterium]|nr:hypothetical protein [Elusimicrobiota bacterium]
MKSVLLALLVAAPAAAEDYALPAPPPGRHADYTADNAEFDADKSSLHLSGHVVLKESTMTVKGADLWIDTARRTGRSDGPLLVEDGVSAVYGESGEFDFAKHTGRLFRTSAGMADWRIHAREANLGDDRKLVYRGADFTSCGAVPPDYHFHASKVAVVPKKSMVAQNVLFYLGDVPVFYTPFLYKSLSPIRWFGWKSQPGLDSRNGPFLKNTLTTQYSESVYSKLFADYYTKQGFGYGGELQRHKGEDSRGALYAYRIHETSTGDDRWTLLGQGYQALPSSSAFQGRFQFQSDADFNNAYQRSSTFRVSPELRNDGAFVHRFSNGVARLSYARVDLADVDRRKYRKSSEAYPRLDYQSQPLRVAGLPWLNTVTAYAVNDYDASRPFLQRSAAAAWEGTRTFGLAKGVSFAPKLGYSETWYSRFDELVSGSSATFRDSSFGRWTATGNLRVNTRVGNWDATHTYSRRLRADGFSEDAAANDKAVERNDFALSDVFIPFPGAWAKLSSGYDFRTYRDHTTGFRDRLQQIVAQTNWRASDRLSFTLRDDYQLQQGNRAVVADARWGDDEGATIGGGLAYNLSEPGRYYGNAEFAVAPSSPTWRLAVILRAYADTPGGAGRLRGGRLFEKEVAWTKRWHDFYTKLGARFRPGGVGEATIRVDF